MSKAIVVLCFLLTTSISSLVRAHWTVQPPSFPVQLEGVYLSDYHCGPQCRDEIINVYHSSVNKTDVLIGIKVKGDEWVPAGEVTFIADAASRQAFVTAARSSFIDPEHTLLRIEVLNDTCFVIEASEGTMNRPLYYYKMREFDPSRDRQLTDMLLVASTSNKNGQRVPIIPSSPSTPSNPYDQCPDMIKDYEHHQKHPIEEIIDFLMPCLLIWIFCTVVSVCCTPRMHYSL